MAIVTLDDEDKELNYDQVAQPPKNIPDTPSVVVNKVLPDKNVYETIEIVNRDEQLDKIVQYISGEEWTVDYYLQLITKDSEIGPFDPNSPNVSKQYLLLKEMILYVDSALQQNAAQELTGSARINSNVTPNAGDVFTATIMGKRKALISITKAEKQTYNLNNIFYIEYKLMMFLDTNDSVLGILADKVSKTYYYDRDFLMTDSSPILLEEDFKTKRKIKISIKDVIQYYFETMFNSERSLLTIPGQETVVIDIMMQEYIFKIVNSTDSPYIARIGRNMIPDDAMQQHTILDAFARRDINILNSCNRKIHYINTACFSSNIKLRTIAYMGIHYLAYPVTPDTKIMETPLRTGYSGIHKLIPTPNPYRDNKGEIANLVPIIDPESEFYIFSEAFYKQDRENMTKFETVALQYLLQESISNEVIGELIDDYKYWDRLQQFYLIPILIVILRDAIYKSTSIT